MCLSERNIEVPDYLNFEHEFWTVIREEKKQLLELDELPKFRFGSKTVELKPIAIYSMPPISNHWIKTNLNAPKISIALSNTFSIKKYLETI